MTTEMAVEAGKVVRPDKAAEGGLLDEEWVAIEPPKVEDMLPSTVVITAIFVCETPERCPLIKIL